MTFIEEQIKKFMPKICEFYDCSDCNGQTYPNCDLIGRVGNPCTGLIKLKDQIVSDTIKATAEKMYNKSVSNIGKGEMGLVYEPEKGIRDARDHLISQCERKE